MYKIKCSNGKYVQKTTYGSWITYSKYGKVFSTKNIAIKNLHLCIAFAENSTNSKYKKLTYELEELRKA